LTKHYNPQLELASAMDTINAGHGQCPASSRQTSSAQIRRHFKFS